jgi:nitroimidazol reductase NimA-like FMN-containing flavoprotein (pyridoxamine 5'-phosphate oxidase superfamily)
MSGPDTPEGDRMTDEEMVAFLQSHGHGVLSLPDDGDVYSIPVSFGYAEDEAVVYLYLNRFGEDSAKLDLVQRTDRASIVAYDVESRDAWRSVSLTGELKDLGSATSRTSTTDLANKQYVRKVMAENAWFPEFADDADEINESRVFLFVIDEMTGRQGAAFL